MKKIGIGYEDFKDFTKEKMYYVDKTMLIRDIVEKGGKTTLFTRPRRFGKTLALSMIRTFFELEYDENGEVVDNRRYFDGMKIMDAGDGILDMMGQYPVINMSLKSAKQPDFFNAFIKLRDDIYSEILRHYYLKDSDKLNAADKAIFDELYTRTALEKLTDAETFRTEVGRYSTALKTLSGLLKKHHGRNVIILIDEYDVPLENAWFCGFYDEMVGFIRSLFESALKTNDALERAVVTGCLRISRESIFTGLNNLVVNSIRGGSFGEYFGFTQDETEAMLIEYSLEDKIELVKKWYDGYLFGEAEVYNPWSVTYFVYDHLNAPERFAEPYWANTSSNSIIKELIENADEDVRRELDELIGGGIIEKQIHEDITYGDIHENGDNLWNFLFFTGYMKKVSERQEDDAIYMSMCIPNTEVKGIYKNQISGWFDKVVKGTGREELYKAIFDKDTEKIADFISDLLAKSISTFDSEEAFYHGYFLSLLNGVPRYSSKSNREEGDGRPEVILYPLRPKDPAYIFEIKVRKKYNEMEDGIREAFDQIRDKKYEEGILDDGYAGVISYGICFCKKSCIVELYSKDLLQNNS
ncbi:MAG: AAA family ATPase [Lachnospiraceae bacterium]|nr:AAA family ATPase [Lachnospiraceae bacterium]